MPLKNIKYVYSNALIQIADTNPAVKGRASLVHELICSYGLLNHLTVLHPRKCNFSDLKQFHRSDYVEYLASNAKKLSSLEVDDSDHETIDTSDAEEYGLGFDCPLWPNIDDYVCSISGATMTACYTLCKNQRCGGNKDIIINWTGGWHHAHRDKAAGYCYINDIVLGILLLKKTFKRILYIDLDVHHGDGVQEAFETTKRVFTLSFHRYECGFYPGTGNSENCGLSQGKGYSANFPYQSGIIGEHFKLYFKRILTNICNRYQPDVCVVQCGADCIVGDPLGNTNLTPDDLISAITMILNYDLPTLLLGGGGYNFENTSRYWTQILATICEQQLSDDIPEENKYFLNYGPDFTVRIHKNQYIPDLNTINTLEKNAKIIEDNLFKYNVCAI